MNKRTISNLSKLFFGVLILAALTAVPCYADEEKNEVRVAYFDLSDYFQVRSDGTIDSLDSAYLDAVSEYTDLKFSYVDCGTWDNALKMLENHEVDLVGTMQWTKEREERFEICDNNYGYAVAELAARAYSGYVYEDYAGINGATVGYLESSATEIQLQDLMEEKGLSFNLKAYASQSEVAKALNDGDIDLIAGNSHVMQSDWVLIEKFHYGPMYFASWKGNSKITNKISEALVKINLYEPDLNERLIEKYFGNIAYSPYNKEEIDCINKKMTYPVYLDQDTRPVAWYDEASGAMSGIIVDICKDLEEKTGLHFNYQPYSKMTENTDSCCVSYRVVDPDDKNSGNEGNITDSIGEFRFSLYHKNGNSFDTIKPYSIACLKNRSGLVKYLKIKYPLCTITEYDTPEECLNLVHEGKEDLAFLNSSIADSLIITNSINDISTLPSTSKNFGIRLEFKGDDSALLVQIVNKGIRLTDGSVMSASMLKYATESKPKTDFLYYVKNNPILAVAILLCIIVVLVLICALLFYARIMKKDKMRAEAVSKERAAFFSRMSHDMRTPMNGILGLTSLSKDEYNSTVLRDNLQKIDESGQYLIGLINDTLDYQKIEAGRMELVYETVSADELIRTGTQMILRLAEEKGVSFKIVNKNADLSKYIRTDVIRIKQLFTNLLSNAVKFTPKGGSVEMIIEVVNRDDKGVKDRITVSDTGIGMSESFIKNGLFKPFIQEENKITSQYAGTGLGLSIAKQIADLMGASISVESHPGEGTKFTVYIAFETVEPVAVEKQTVEKSCSKADAYMILKGKRVLMAEDHPLNAEITEKLLERKDVSVIWAKDGRQCVDIFTGSKEGSFDAVLMDIRMPGMDGIEATEVIRALERTDAKTVPIIAMSANAYTEDVRKSLDAGMNAHLAKPVQPDRLYGTLVMFIQKSGSDK